MTNSITSIAESDFLEYLRSSIFFEGYSEPRLRKMRRNEAVSLHRLAFREVVWSEYEVPFSVLLQGCLSVISTGIDQDTLSLFIPPGQLLGEFEVLDVYSPRNQFVTVTEEAILLTFSHRILLELADEYPQIFYKNMARCLIGKMKIQNDLAKIRNKRSIADRFAHLLRQFKIWNWPDIVTYRGDKRFDIELIWSIRQLEYCLVSEMRSILPTMEKLLDEEIIEIEFSDPDENFLSEPSSVFRKYSRVSRSSLPNILFKISVRDYDKLLREKIQDY
jgi:CRP-like cAMP-binding protein